MSGPGLEVKLSDGVKVQVWLFGGEDKKKPLLIALHGAPGLSSHTEPEGSFSYLADRFRVLVYDARGSGVSDRKGPYTDERWIKDLDELRAWAGAEKFVLAGGSYGGFIAQGYALTFPNRLSALILRDTWACGPRGTLRVLAKFLTTDRITPDPARQVRVWSGNLIDNEDFKKGFLEIVPMYTPESKPPAPFEGTERDLNLNYEAQNAAFSFNVPRFDVRTKLHQITAPALVLVGRHDTVCTVEDAEEIHNAIAGSELVIFENSGHAPASDEPEAFRQTVSKFLDGLKL